MPKIKTIILGNYKPHTYIHTGNVIMLKTKEHPSGGLHLIEYSSSEKKSGRYIDLHTKKWLIGRTGEKINDNDILKYKVELTEKETIEFWNNNLKDMYL